MLARITGILAEINEEGVLLERDGLGWEVLVPGYAVGWLAPLRGQAVTLHTLEFFEGTPAGSHLVHRLIGFPSPGDKAFFERFVTVKGIGVRKALRAMREPVAAIASAIEGGDVASLSRLPGIGRRAAEQIVAELRGKVQAFATGEVPAGPALPELSEAQRDAIEVLVSLGEKRGDAERWVRRAAARLPEDTSADTLIRAAFDERAAGG